MRTWWRDTRFQEFWRDVGAILMALAIFTVPLTIAFNLTAGGWVARTEDVRDEANAFLMDIKQIRESIGYINACAQARDVYMDERMSAIEGKLNALNSSQKDVLDRLDSTPTSDQSIP